MRSHCHLLGFCLTVISSIQPTDPPLIVCHESIIPSSAQIPYIFLVSEKVRSARRLKRKEKNAAPSLALNTNKLIPCSSIPGTEATHRTNLFSFKWKSIYMSVFGAGPPCPLIIISSATFPSHTRAHPWRASHLVVPYANIKRPQIRRNWQRRRQQKKQKTGAPTIGNEMISEALDDVIQQKANALDTK